ncbi:MAG: hypothetical protein LBQ10_01250 [Desulfovibrio sp.]|nr:hypothetical protein [Desulfovibrio sp.]
MKDWKAYRREYSRDRYDTLKRHGLCVQCGKNEAVAGRAMCEPCAARHRKKPPKPKRPRSCCNIATWRKLKKEGKI